MTATLREQIARTIRLSETRDTLPPGFGERMWDDGVTDRSEYLAYADAVLAEVVTPALEAAKTEGAREVQTAMREAIVDGVPLGPAQTGAFQETAGWIQWISTKYPKMKETEG